MVLIAAKKVTQGLPGLKGVKGLVGLPGYDGAHGRKGEGRSKHPVHQAHSRTAPSVTHHFHYWLERLRNEMSHSRHGWHPQFCIAIAVHSVINIEMKYKK